MSSQKKTTKKRARSDESSCESEEEDDEESRHQPRTQGSSNVSGMLSGAAASQVLSAGGDFGTPASSSQLLIPVPAGAGPSRDDKIRESNRLRAQRNRIRKKQMLDEMKRTIMVLYHENDELRRRNAVLMDEVLRLMARNGDQRGPLPLGLSPSLPLQDPPGRIALSAATLGSFGSTASQPITPVTNSSPQIPLPLQQQSQLIAQMFGNVPQTQAQTSLASNSTSLRSLERTLQLPSSQQNLDERIPEGQANPEMHHNIEEPSPDEILRRNGDLQNKNK